MRGWCVTSSLLNPAMGLTFSPMGKGAMQSVLLPSSSSGRALGEMGLGPYSRGSPSGVDVVAGVAMPLLSPVEGLAFSPVEDGGVQFVLPSSILGGRALGEAGVAPPNVGPGPVLDAPEPYSRGSLSEVGVVCGGRGVGGSSVLSSWVSSSLLRPWAMMSGTTSQVSLPL